MHNASFLLLLSLGRADCSTLLLQDKTRSLVLSIDMEQNRTFQLEGTYNDHLVQICAGAADPANEETLTQESHTSYHEIPACAFPSCTPRGFTSPNLPSNTSTFLPCSKLCSILYSKDEAGEVKRWPILPDSEPPTPWTGWRSFQMQLQVPALPFQWENWSLSS